MDLLYRYEVFSREVLTLAREHPILRYAACAVAAKQLGQMKIPVSTVLRGKTHEKIANRLSQGRYGLVWYGIKYYEKAIQTLVKSIAPRSQQPEQISATSVSVDDWNLAMPAAHDSPVSLTKGDLMVRAEGEDPIVRLLGFAKLLELIDDGQLVQRHPLFEQVYPWTKDIMAVKAGFWNFVVNDMEESFVSHQRTRIDTENLALWRNVGLMIQDDGSLATTADAPHSLTSIPEHARDKVLSYTLIRLMCKLINYLAPNENRSISNPPGSMPALTVSSTSFPLAAEYATPEQPSGSPSSLAALANTATFVDLENQFDSWHKMLSPSFHPDGTFYTSAAQHNSNEQATHTTAGEQQRCLFSRELWFSNDLCATTMMYYNMARMLLLIHRPPDLLFRLSSGVPGINTTMPSQSSSFDLLHAFRDIEMQLQRHASEVIAIFSGTPCDAIKLRAIQPLYVAGRCCTTLADRQQLIHMLTDIQDKLGIATGYRVRALINEWGANSADFNLNLRLANEEL
ncbi:hypothetical protein SEUCBS140593_002915 [Sporothrix eucalyptigena]|uniref:Uncharacterized protein n=1 Tax=Sporothrix eucalyptigena TaxID=1812306 RepID=A0ABP0BAQ0_9PEZI